MSSYMNRLPISWVIYPPYPETEPAKKAKRTPKAKTAKPDAEPSAAKRKASSRRSKSPQKIRLKPPPCRMFMRHDKLRKTAIT